MTATPQMSYETAHEIEREVAERQYLTFMLSAEEYGLEILRVQEIKGWEASTPIPNTPEHVTGVINIRGEIVPIMDLRKRFDLDAIPRSPTTVIIVVRVNTENQERTIGLVVDAVSEVYRFKDHDIQPTPNLGDGISAECISGLASIEEKMVLLLDVDKLIDLDTVNMQAELSPPQ